MRLFLAVPTDPETRQAARDAIDALRRRFGGDYRFEGVDDLHVTLVFLGETPDARVPGVLARMREVAARTRPFEVRFGALGAFDSPDDARIVWLGVDEGAAELAALADALGRDEPRAYRAHLTLARRRSDRAPAGIGAFLRGFVRPDLRRPVARVVLYESGPGGAGPRYRPLGEVALAG